MNNRYNNFYSWGRSVRKYWYGDAVWARLVFRLQLRLWPCARKVLQCASVTRLETYRYRFGARHRLRIHWLRVWILQRNKPIVYRRFFVESVIFCNWFTDLARRRFGRRPGSAIGCGLCRRAVEGSWPKSFSTMGEWKNPTTKIGQGSARKQKNSRRKPIKYNYGKMYWSLNAPKIQKEN